VDAVYSISWAYDDLPEQIAQALDLKPGKRKLSGFSGTSPQRFLNQAAEKIMRGEQQAVLVCGAEAFATKKRAKKEGRLLDWPRAEKKSPPPFEDPFHPAEIAHNLFQAYTAFALLDSARRAHHKLSLQQNREQQAQMMARLSEVAAANPRAWFRKTHSAESLLNMDNKDRMVAYPFTKNTMAFMEVDMAAAVIMVSDTLADELKIPPQKRIYLNGWGYAKEPPYLAQREKLWQCPAMALAAQQALESAGISMKDITCMDLYSCFSGNLNMTRDVLGMDENDSRPLTLTGGLPYFGGPGNNYTTHSIATLVEMLRQHPEQYGLISGVGMNMTHHVFAVYSGRAQVIHNIPETDTPDWPVKTITETAEGEGLIAAYTVEHNKSGLSALAICDLPDHTRCYARSEDQALCQAMEETEWVGRKVILHSENQVNTFKEA
jgi:acetyl-CoA C-acetyltransferase